MFFVYVRLSNKAYQDFYNNFKKNSENVQRKKKKKKKKKRERFIDS